MNNNSRMVACVALIAFTLVLGASVSARAAGMDVFHLRVAEDTSLSEDQREAMDAHVVACEELGMSPEHMDVLFPEGRPHYSAQARLRMQGQVIDAARAGYPIDLICSKIGEGMMKHAGEPQVEHAVQRMGECVGVAHQQMELAFADGVSGLDDPSAQQHLHRGLAMDMWRGLDESELDHLRSRARDRMQNGDCTITDIAAAAETATELKEIGVNSDTALGLCGDALANGYTAEHVRGMGHMAMYADMNGESGVEFCKRLHEQVREHAGYEHMQGTMMHEGWMGPESMGHGHGGGSPVDDVMGGGHHSGDGGHHSGDDGGGHMGDGDRGGGMGGHQ